MRIEFSNSTYDFSPWKPHHGRISIGQLAIDCETCRINDHRPWETPSFVLAAAFDGERGWFITRQYLFEFLSLHPQFLIFHNAAFDLDVIASECRGHQDFDIYNRVESGSVADTLILHKLFQLATTGNPANAKGESTLEACAETYLGLSLPKDVKDSNGDDVRTSYHKFLTADPRDIPCVYLEYLAKDTIATYRCFSEIVPRINLVLSNCSDSFGFISQDYINWQSSTFGPLTHNIQLKASIVLRSISAAGLHVDPQRLGHVAASISQDLIGLKRGLREYGYIPGSKGNRKVLEQILVQIERRNPGASIPRALNGSVSTKADDLEQIATLDPFIAMFIRHQNLEKLHETFVAKMGRGVLHPSFQTLVSTGRTSSFGDINSQNIPRNESIRSCFVPSSGHVFIDSDYKSIEMATLAQTIIRQFGMPSQLAGFLNGGLDPHLQFAASVLRKNPEQVTDDERRKAKAINFGKPAGMCARSIQSHAQSTFGIPMTLEEAEEMSNGWLNTYPEMRHYLQDDVEAGREIYRKFNLSIDLLNQQRGRPCQSNRNFRDEEIILGKMLLKVAGNARPHAQSGRPYSEIDVEYLWGAIRGRLHDFPSEVQQSILHRRASSSLRNAVRAIADKRSVITYTGRVRAACSYTARRNTPFQGLAADGAKIALWKLWRSDYRIVNFIHDEILIEVPKESDVLAHRENIKQLMIEAMREVVPDVRVDVEQVVSECWRK